MVNKKIPFVDEDDNILGYKERSGEIKKEIYRVAALWITNSKKQVLLARRALTKTNNPGRWGPAVAGTVEEGETYESNIIKEAEEELSLKNINIEKGKKVRVKGKYNFFCQYFMAKIDKGAEDFNFNREEVLEVKWFTKQEILDMAKNHPEELTESYKYWVDLFC
jgi:isopentenyldiphosphate isomerase